MAKRQPKSRKEAAPAPARPVRTRWVAALLALLTILFFHQVALEGMTFVSPDTTQPVGFVRVGEQSLWKDHVYPLWNPFVFLGMPSFASGAYNPLIYPPDWPLALLARVLPLPDMTWMLLYYFLGGMFLYLLAREWGARPEGALLGAVAFVFAPNLVAIGSHGHGSQLVNSAYLPLLLWLAARWMRRGGLENLGLLALAGGFQMLRGHAQVAFYTWFAIGLYLLVELVAGGRGDAKTTLGTRLARAAGIGCAMALAFGIAGFYNLPLRDYARHSIRGGGPGGGVGMEYATAWSLAPWELPTLVVPGWVGFGGEVYWGGMPFTDYPNAYVGVVVVALALPALLLRGRPQAFALTLAVVALLIAMGKYLPIYGFLYEHLPLFNKFRVPVMIVILFQLAAALGMAWGWSLVLESPEGKRPALRKLLIAAAGVFAIAFLLALGGSGALRGGYVAAVASHRPDLPREAAEIAFRGFVGDLARAALLGLVAVGLAVLALRRRLDARVATLAVLVLLLVELWPVSGRVMAPVIGPRTPRILDQGRDDVVEFLEKAGPPGAFRVLPVAEMMSNRYSGFAVASLGGYHAAKPRLYQDLVDARATENPVWWRLLNVRYVVTPQPVQAPGFRLAYQGGAGAVYENPDALPRVTMVGSYRVEPNARALLDSISSGRHDPATVTWLAEDPRLALGPVAGARAELTHYGLHDVRVRVETPGPALLRLADLWYPDWSATVDGKATPILRADYLLRAVAVPAGRHEVRFQFRSASVQTGLLVSLASLALSLGLLSWGWIARRRAPAAAGAA